MAVPEKKEEKIVPPEGGYGWVIVTATTLMSICLTPLILNFGIIYKSDFEAKGVTSTGKSFLLHLHTAIYCIIGLLGVPLLKIYNFRQVALLGASIWCSGIFLTSFANSYILLIFTVSIIIGIGQGILLPATYLANNTYFKKRLTLVTCLSVTGGGISSIFMPQVCTKLVGSVGLKYTVLVLFAISLIAIVGACLLKPLKKPKKEEQAADIIKLDSGKEKTEEILELKNEDNGEAKETLLPPTNGTVYKETTTPVVSQGVFSKISNMFNLELLKERTFLLVLLAVSVSFGSELNTVLTIQFIVPDLAKFSREDVALATSIQSAADIVGRLAIPFLGHMVDVHPKIMYGTSLLVSTLGRTFLTIFSGTRIAVFGCFVLLGLGKGIKAVYQSVIIPKYVSLDKLPGATGLNFMMNGIMALLIGILIGQIGDAGGSSIYALHATSIISMLCLAMWVYDYLAPEKEKKTDVTTDPQ